MKVLSLIGLVAGCGATETGKDISETCSRQAAMLSCPPGTGAQTFSKGEATCDGDGSFNPTTKSVEAAGKCGSSGECTFACVAAHSCECGASKISHNEVLCKACNVDYRCTELVHRRRDAIKHAFVRLDDSSRRFRPRKGCRTSIPSFHVGSKVVTQSLLGYKAGRT